MRWTVGAKITGGYAVAVTILLTIGTSSYLSTRRLIDAADLRAHTYEVLDNLEGLISDLKDAETGQRGFLLTNKDSYLEPYASAQNHITQRLAALQELIGDSSSQRARLDEIRPLIDLKMSELAETIQARRGPGDGFKAALDIVFTDKGKQTMDSIRLKIGEMEGDEKDVLERRNLEAASTAQSAIATILYGVPLAAIIMATVGWLIVRNISRPLVLMADTAQKISLGDIAVKLPELSRQDEVGALSRSFTTMIQWLQGMSAEAARIADGDLRGKLRPQSDRDQLGNTFSQMVDNLQRLSLDLTEGVNVLSSAAKEIAASSTQLASSATETATAVAQTTSTVEEVRQTAQVASQKSKYVAEAAQKVAVTSQAGKKATEQTSQGMTRIQEQMASVAQSMVRLSEQGQAIGQIISTVDDLSQQSNVLAVNASIEAAKAGEQGKGFAVVAQEIRSLAEQSKQATSQVRDILSEVQRATSGAVMAADQGAKVVESGVKQSAEAGESIIQLATSVAESAQAAQQIAASSQQQLVGMDQVVTAVDTIKQASTQNVESAKQLEASARNLNDLGQRLKDLVSRYKLNHGLVA